MSNAVETQYDKLANALDVFEGRGKGESLSDFLKPSESNLLSSIPGALVLFAANGMQLWSNEAAKALVGSNADVVINANPQNAVEVLQMIASAAREGKQAAATIKVQSVDASGVAETQTLDLLANPFRPEEKILPEEFALVAITDKTAENELEVRLHHARQEGEDKNRFFSSMSHELRTPLNAIIGFSELLEGKACVQLNDVKRLEYAGLIGESANHLLGLINDILDLSRLDAGKGETHKQLVDLGSSLDAIVRSMTPIAMRKSVDLIVEENNGIPEIHSDKRALTQIVTNILSNAIKFSHDDGVVRLKLMRLRNRVKIIVTDNGIGMDTETLSKLGGLFYQSGDVISGDYGGSGLGLSIVYKLVELLGGKISISSQRGEGTTVSVILPTGCDLAKPVPASSGADVVYLSAPQEKPALNSSKPMVNSGAKQ